MFGGSVANAIEYGISGPGKAATDGDWAYLEQVIEYMENSDVRSFRTSFSCASYIDYIVHGAYPDSGAVMLENFEDFLDRCDAANIEVTFLLVYGSEYHYRNMYEETGCATITPPNGIRYQMPPEDEYWIMYVQEMVERFGPRVTGFEVWNEPDWIEEFFHGRVEDYIHLFNLASAQIKSVMPDMPVCSGGLAGIDSVYESYLEKLLDPHPDPDEESIFDLCDAFGLHTYSDSAIATLRKYHEVCKSMGIVPKPVWITEFARKLNESSGKYYSLNGARAYPEHVMEIFESYGVERAFWYCLTKPDDGLNLFKIDQHGVLQDADNKWKYYSAAAEKSQLFNMTDIAGFGYDDQGTPLFGISPFEEYSSSSGLPGYPMEYQSTFTFCDSNLESPLSSDDHNGLELPIAFDVSDMWVEQFSGNVLLLTVDVKSAGNIIELRYENGGDHSFVNKESNHAIWNNMICDNLLDGLAVQDSIPDFRMGVDDSNTTIETISLVPGQLTSITVPISDYTFQNGLTKRADFKFVPVNNEPFEIHRVTIQAQVDGQVTYQDKSSETLLLNTFDGQPRNGAAVDYNGDGLKDLMITKVSGTSNNGLAEMCQGYDGGVPIYEDLTLDAFSDSPPPPGGTDGLILADIDNDGLVDFFAPNLQGCRLYHNVGGEYSDITDDSGLNNAFSPSIGGSWGDYDSDGDVDLLVLAVDETYVPGVGAPIQRLYRNDQDEYGRPVFVDVTLETGLFGYQNGSLSHSALWADFDNDGDLDLVTFGGRHNTTNAHRYWVNQLSETGTATFINEVLERWPDSTDVYDVNGMATVADIDSDGDLDVAFANAQSVGWFGNNGNGYLSLQSIFEVSGEVRDIDVLDYDLDGRIDILVSRSNGTALYGNRVEGSTVALVDETALSNLGDTGVMHGSVLSDFNPDGIIDIFKTRTSTGNFFYKGNGPSDVSKRNWIGIKLESPYGANNRYGLGTTVTVETANSIQSQVVDGGSGWAGGRDSDLIFGLGYYIGSVTVTVKWTNGHTMVEVFSSSQFGNYQTIVDDSPVVDESTIAMGFMYDLSTGTQDWMFSWETFNGSLEEKDVISFDTEGLDERCWPQYLELSSAIEDGEMVEVAAPAFLGNSKWAHKISLYNQPCEPRCTIPFTVKSGIADYSNSISGHHVKVRSCILSN